MLWETEELLGGASEFRGNNAVLGVVEPEGLFRGH